MSKFHRLNINFPAKLYERMKAQAVGKQLSVSAYLLGLVQADLGQTRDGAAPAFETQPEALTLDLSTLSRNLQALLSDQAVAELEDILMEESLPSRLT